MSGDTPPPINAPDNRGIITQGQSGGTNIINQAVPDLVFTPQVAADLLAKIPKGKPIFIEIIGPKPSDIATGIQIKDFLIANGYQVKYSSAMNRLPQPPYQLEWNPTASVLTIAPSVK
jgi:hypothetical protein